MKVPKFYYLFILPFALLTSACSNNAVKADEPQITTMDSIANELNETNKQLDEKAKNLEAAIEKADKETATSE
jgi:hypothetical protein